MSTRSQVQVRCKPNNFAAGHEGQRITLYHHTDGYPSYMLPKILSAYRDGPERQWRESDASLAEWVAFWAPDGSFDRWQYERPGKAAGFLCATDPGIFEPEDSHDLHSDIEYYYIVYVAADGWDVEVQERDYEAETDHNSIKLHTIFGPGPIADAIAALCK